ncbi:MAG: nucleoside-diphosphate kinase [Candidatus Babeliales bacterium]|nr:nucleoside-diphosphate kinase [Candidatus Babeliales bacterium]
MKTFNIFKREQELTLAIIKPDAVAAKNTGKIIDIIEQTGFDIVGLEKITLNKEKAEQFYAVHKDRPFYNDLVKFMTEGPVVVIALSKENAVADWRNLMGATNPENADSNTIRKLFGTSIQRNATHGSDSVENAKNEVKFFFPNIK